MISTRRRQYGLSLPELLVATALLTMSVAAIVNLWHVSRSVSERSRNWAEYYAVARQEVEKGKNSEFNTLFIATGNIYSSTNNPQRTDYDQYGNPLATNLGSNASPTANAYYRAVSTYSLVTTSGETQNTRKLGVQQISVYAMTNGTSFDTTASYQTTVFYSAPGV